MAGPDHPIDMGGLVGGGAGSMGGLVGGGAGSVQQGDAAGGPRSSPGGSSSGIVGLAPRLPSLPLSSPYQTTQGSTGPASGSARDALVDRLREFDGEEQAAVEGNSSITLGRHRMIY